MATTTTRMCTNRKPDSRPNRNNIPWMDAMLQLGLSSHRYRTAQEKAFLSGRVSFVASCSALLRLVEMPTCHLLTAKLSSNVVFCGVEKTGFRIFAYSVTGFCVLSSSSSSSSRPMNFTLPWHSVGNWRMLHIPSTFVGRRRFQRCETRPKICRTATTKNVAPREATVVGEFIDQKSSIR